MRRAFEHLGNVYHLTFSAQAGAAAQRLSFNTARRLLGVPASASRMRELRALLATRSPASVVSRMTDAEVVEHLASRIATRSLHVYTEEASRVAYRGAQQPEALDDALAPMSLREVDEPANDNLDVPAQVAVMKDAARDGTPFCEECEKARLAALEDAPEPFADTDVPAQAAAMRSAAEDGAPFCEECEKARLALEKAEAEAPPDAYADTDVPAQAATMRAAAEDGAPFCEECEKARLALEKAEAPPDAYADTDVPAQAATMRAAAANGTPFCEECEKARLAALASKGA